MQLTKFALFTHDLNTIQNLEDFSSHCDLNPERILDHYQLVFIYLDTEENFKKSLSDNAELSEQIGKLVGISLPNNNVLNWLPHYPVIHSCLDLNQFRLLLDSHKKSVTHNGIFLKVKNRLEKINFNQIRLIVAKDVYSIIKTEDARYLVGHSLKEMEEKLLPYNNFKRIHRSYIVNIEFIEAIEEGNLVIDSEAIPIGPAYKDALMARLLFM